MKMNSSAVIAVTLVSGMLASARAQPALKDVFQGDFMVGAALNGTQISNAAGREIELVRKHFNTITAENVMKWEAIHPAPGRYDFDASDRFVAFGQKHKMFIVGHTLIWHSQTPGWVFEDNGRPASREVLLKRMRDHIQTVVGRYRGKVGGWDVVNEALNSDGSRRDTPWRRIIGDDYISKAFEFVHEADPKAELYYNDFSMENARKRSGGIALIKQLQAQGVKVSGVGLQGHYGLNAPPASQINETIAAFAALGVKVMITELDVDVLPRTGRSGDAEVSFNIAARPELNPYTNGLPAAVQEHLARRYAELFSIFGAHRDVLSRVTFWGVTDRNSWLNNWPVRGRTSHPLLFDRDGGPKPALDAVIETRKPGLSSVKSGSESS